MKEGAFRDRRKELGEKTEPSDWQNGLIDLPMDWLTVVWTC